jgi:hypothetical protein
MNVINERDWAAKTAMRLHIWQESFAADDPSTRGAAVWQYIADALAELGEMDERFRVTSLRALDEEFPFYQERKVLEASARNDPLLVKKATEASPLEPTDAQTLTERLIQEASGLSADRRESIAKQLAEVGIVLPQNVAAGPVAEALSRNEVSMHLTVPEYKDEIARLGKTVEKIQSTLGSTKFQAGKVIHLIRSMQMLGLMSEQFLQLHPQVWAMWEKIVTNHQYTTSFHKPALSPDESLAQFLLGAPSTKRADVGQMVSKTFYLAVAAVSAVETAGKEFAAWFFDKFGPQNIESIVQYESKGGDSTPQDYWKHYLHLAETYSTEELSEQFLNLLGRNMLRIIQTKKM